MNNSQQVVDDTSAGAIGSYVSNPMAYYEDIKQKVEPEVVDKLV